MSARDLLLQLERLGVELRADGTDLEYEGPDKTITPELLDELRRHKAALIELLTGDRQRTTQVFCPTTSSARRLWNAGWKPKERSRKTIWENPITGFYFSEDVALATVNRGGPA